MVPAPGTLRLEAEVVDSLQALGFVAFTTGREAGSFGTQTDEPVREVMGRWAALRSRLGERLATASQVHGNEILEYDATWTGWLRGDAADGHLARRRGTAMAVSVADCVPVFLAHPSGAGALLHSGWRGTESRITERAIRRLDALGFPARELRLHCGPAICGRCYEVSAEVASRLLGRDIRSPITVDLREIIAGHAGALGVRDISISPRCTRCDNELFFSHRAGDVGRQLGVLLAPHNEPVQKPEVRNASRSASTPFAAAP
ncbi:MAG TPA: polyphenol oxidase family protein [Gemmatimonadaceae bacterium]|nr:polyphenol oxidase family protein [Gemmatimonadaceae bacterium]